MIGTILSVPTFICPWTLCAYVVATDGYAVGDGEGGGGAQVAFVPLICKPACSFNICSIAP
jgi:hypothetical protein